MATRKKKCQKPKRRNVYAVSARARKGGAHTDKRRRRNQKNRKFNAWEGY